MQTREFTAGRFLARTAEDGSTSLVERRENGDEIAELNMDGDELEDAFYVLRRALYDRRDRRRGFDRRSGSG